MGEGFITRHTVDQHLRHQGLPEQIVFVPETDLEVGPVLLGIEHVPLLLARDW
jgi:hypothetical protein